MPHNTENPSVLFVNYTPYGGGDTVALYRMAAYLSTNGHRVGIATPPNKWLESRIDATRITLISVDIPKLEKFASGFWGYTGYVYRLFRAIMRLRRIMRDGDWDIAHVNTLPNLAGAIAARIAGVSLVWHVHEIMFQSRLGFMMLRLLPGLLAQAVLCPSCAVLRVFSGKNAYLLPNIVPEDWAQVEAFAVAKVREENEVREGDKVLLWIGGIEPRKGLEQLLDVLPDVDDLHDLVLLIVCSVTPKYQDLYRRLREKAGKIPVRIRFVENVADPRPYYAACDVVAQTSTLPEAFGLTVLEAMAMGKPVFCAGTGGTKEFAIDGETAVIANPNDPAQLKSVLGRLLTDEKLAGRIGDAARKQASGYSAQWVMPTLEAIYEAVS